MPCQSVQVEAVTEADVSDLVRFVAADSEDTIQQWEDTNFDLDAEQRVGVLLLAVELAAERLGLSWSDVVQKLKERTE